ncbi:hypothetical protein TYRP_009524 [Tyrophagus putrescentiae]|nr:hypothetical protein TYRP_009524 [Tyrophagus putrescentiae]
MLKRKKEKFKKCQEFKNRSGSFSTSSASSSSSFFLTFATSNGVAGHQKAAQNLKEQKVAGEEQRLEDFEVGGSSLSSKALAPETEATSTTPIEAVNRVAQQQKAKAQGRQMQSRIRQTMPSHQYQAREVEVEEFPEESRSAFRLGRVLQAKQQIAAGHIYHAHFELIETDCDRQLTAAEDVSSCGEKRRLLCEATIWSKPSKREEQEEVEVTKFSCKSKE